MRYFRIAQRNFNKKQMLKMNFLTRFTVYEPHSGFVSVHVSLRYNNSRYIDTPETERLAAMLINSGWEEF